MVEPMFSGNVIYVNWLLLRQCLLVMLFMLFGYCRDNAYW